MHMIQIPAKIQTRYRDLLIKKAIPEKYHFHYMKWLRYYLDFCLKYKFNQSDKESHSHFLNKLQEKNQTEQQQEQASEAISIYYESGATHSSENIPFKNKNAIISTKNEGLKSKNANWKSVYDDLNAEIKIRHYSPKTLKAYKGWVRHFQNYMKSKDPQLLSSADVKDFLTFLAVKRRVSASSQNQAFNALLFFFRHIIKKEFRDLKDVPRAKRKPYIPVVLSRDEIDAITASSEAWGRATVTY